VPTSLFYDFDEFSKKGETYPQLSYMVPSLANFTDSMRRCDVRKSDIVVVYDRVGMLSSPRAYWMLKLFGLTNVYILNGTFAKWETE
jgi:thiosulfate/3-mercaptopyruvate sulfurtransferase